MAIKKPERWVILGDLQVPFHYAPAVELASQVVRAVKPDHIVYNGDNTDNWRVSGHAKRGSENNRKDNVQDDFDMTIELQDRIAAGAKKAKRHNIDGNHEEMFDKYIGTKAPELSCLRSSSMEEQMAYEKRGFASYHPYRDGLWIGDNLFVTHGDCVRKTPGDSVAQMVAKVDEAVIMNHVHRKAHIRFKKGRRDLMGIENGCLCQFDPSYATHTNWAHCLTVVSQHDNKHFTAEVVDLVMDHHSGQLFAWWRDEKMSVPLSYDDGMSIPWRAASGSEY